MSFISPLNRAGERFSWPVLCALASALFLYSAVFTGPFFHVDEHFQVIEFANLKLGGISPQSLPWEFGAQIRPFFQPACFYLLAKGLRSAGIDSPFAISFGFRVLSALLCLWAVLSVVKAIPLFIRQPDLAGKAELWSVIFWIVAWIAVRPSSEGWSGSLFFLGWVRLCLETNRSHVPRLEQLQSAAVIAAFFLLAFEARYQIGFSIAGIALWLFLFHRRGRSTFMLGIAGFFLFGLGLFLFVDRWGYGTYVFPPWGYFKINLLQGVAGRMGTEPWWYYLRVLFLKTFPFGLLIIPALHYAWIRDYRSPLTWTTLWFYLGHVACAHKELRFLFPMILAVPLVTARGIELFSEDFPVFYKKIRQRFSPKLYRGAIYLNAALLLVAPPLTKLETFPVYKYFYRHDVHSAYFEGNVRFNLSWYLRQPFKLIPISASSRLPEGESYLIVAHDCTYEDVGHETVPSGCRLILSNMPGWFRKDKWRGIRKRARVTELGLYRCQM